MLHRTISYLLRESVTKPQCLRNGFATSARSSLRVSKSISLHNCPMHVTYSLHEHPFRLQLRSHQSTLRSVQAETSVLNPRTADDDEGNEMKIEITPRAAKRLREIMEKDDNFKLALRVIVESGGCHGFQYVMSLTENYGENTDTVFELGGSKVVLDEPSLELLKGSKIDYTRELIGSQFKVVDNPYASSSCGCGTSFDIKV